jgi:hypothetical protein
MADFFLSFLSFYQIRVRLGKLGLFGKTVQLASFVKIAGARRRPRSTLIAFSNRVVGLWRQAGPALPRFGPFG